MSDTIHGPENFHNFPFEKISKDTEMKNWSWGVGGSQVNGKFIIKYFKNPEDSFDIDQEIWVLPDCLQLMLKRIKQWGSDEAINSIRHQVYNIADILGFKIQ